MFGNRLSRFLIIFVSLYLFSLIMSVNNSKLSLLIYYYWEYAFFKVKFFAWVRIAFVDIIKFDTKVTVYFL